MDTKQVTVLVWDDPEHFNNTQTQRDFGNKSIYKAVKAFHSLKDFEELLMSLSEDEHIVICCHVKYKDYSGYQEFIYSGLLEKYNIPRITYLSSGFSGEVMKGLYEKFNNSEPVILYNELIKGIKLGNIRPTSRRVLLSENSLPQPIPERQPESKHYPQIDYAIITALYQDEFEEVKNFIDFPPSEIISTGKKEYHIGYLKSNRTVKVVAGIPSATGMVDSAIIGTQMMELFRPKYLLMSGVCAGADGLAFGDIVVGSQFFTFQKGKISDVYVKSHPRGKQKKIGLYDRTGKLIDYDNLYDNNGNQVNISIERFQIEHDSIIELDTLLKDKISRHKDDFRSSINHLIKAHNKTINVHMEPIACSTMVINKEGYFEDRIKAVNRKTAAVEMESYGVARACQFANDGKTKSLIFKSVMDHASNKGDTFKRFAAHTSAIFLNLLLESHLLT